MVKWASQGNSLGDTWLPLTILLLAASYWLANPHSIVAVYGKCSFTFWLQIQIEWVDGADLFG